MLVRLLAALPLLSALFSVPAEPGGSARSQPACFPNVPAIHDCVDQAFQSFWTKSGGLAVFGYPTGPALPEEVEVGLRTAQHFERYRLELHPEAPPAYKVQLGRIGAERLALLGRATPRGDGVPATD